MKIMRQVVGVNRELVVVSDDNLVVVPSGRCWLANEVYLPRSIDTYM